jgi:hypothetical protein
MRIRLVRKLADAVDGVDISAYAVGDVLDLPPSEARLLIAEQWAASADTPARRFEVRRFSGPRQVAEAADSARRHLVDRLRLASEPNAPRGPERGSGRRREDMVIDELHDARATTVHADSHTLT